MKEGRATGIPHGIRASCPTSPLFILTVLLLAFHSQNAVAQASPECLVEEGDAAEASTYTSERSWRERIVGMGTGLSAPTGGWDRPVARFGPYEIPLRLFPEVVLTDDPRLPKTAPPPASCPTLFHDPLIVIPFFSNSSPRGLEMDLSFFPGILGAANRPDPADDDLVPAHREGRWESTIEGHRMNARGGLRLAAGGVIDRFRPLGAEGVREDDRGHGLVVWRREGNRGRVDAFAGLGMEKRSGWDLSRVVSGSAGADRLSYGALMGVGWRERRHGGEWFRVNLMGALSGEHLSPKGGSDAPARIDLFSGVRVGRTPLERMVRDAWGALDLRWESERGIQKKETSIQPVRIRLRLEGTGGERRVSRVGGTTFVDDSFGCGGGSRYRTDLDPSCVAYLSLSGGEGAGRVHSLLSSAEVSWGVVDRSRGIALYPMMGLDVQVLDGGGKGIGPLASPAYGLRLEGSKDGGPRLDWRMEVGRHPSPVESRTVGLWALAGARSPLLISIYDGETGDYLASEAKGVRAIELGMLDGLPETSQAALFLRISHPTLGRASLGLWGREYRGLVASVVTSDDPEWITLGVNPLSGDELEFARMGTTRTLRTLPDAHAQSLGGLLHLERALTSSTRLQLALAYAWTETSIFPRDGVVSPEIRSGGEPLAPGPFPETSLWEASLRVEQRLPFGADLLLAYRGRAGGTSIPLLWLDRIDMGGNILTGVTEIPLASAASFPLPDVHRIDARLSTRFRVAPGTSVAVAIEADNLFNSRTPLAWNQTWGAWRSDQGAEGEAISGWWDGPSRYYRQVLKLEEPRQLFLTVRVHYF